MLGVHWEYWHGPISSLQKQQCGDLESRFRATAGVDHLETTGALVRKALVNSHWRTHCGKHGKKMEEQLAL